MNLQLLVAKVLLWVSLPLGLVSAGFTVYFGIDVYKQWTRPDPAQRPPDSSGDHPIEVVARAAGSALQVVNKVGDAIERGLFYASLTGLGIAAVLYFLARKLGAFI